MKALIAARDCLRALGAWAVMAEAKAITTELLRSAIQVSFFSLFNLLHNWLHWSLEGRNGFRVKLLRIVIQDRRHSG